MLGSLWYFFVLIQMAQAMPDAYSARIHLHDVVPRCHDDSDNCPRILYAPSDFPIQAAVDFDRDHMPLVTNAIPYEGRSTVARISVYDNRTGANFPGPPEEQVVDYWLFQCDHGPPRKAIVYELGQLLRDYPVLGQSTQLIKAVCHIMPIDTRKRKRIELAQDRYNCDYVVQERNERYEVEAGYRDGRKIYLRMQSRRPRGHTSSQREHRQQQQQLDYYEDDNQEEALAASVNILELRDLLTHHQYKIERNTDQLTMDISDIPQASLENLAFCGKAPSMYDAVVFSAMMSIDSAMPSYPMIGN